MFLAGQAIVKTEHLNQLNAPGCLHVVPDTFARLPMWWFRVLFPWYYEKIIKEAEMKLYIFFALIDLLILLAYPFLFIASKIRKILRFKR